MRSKTSCGFWHRILLIPAFQTSSFSSTFAIMADLLSLSLGAKGPELLRWYSDLRLGCGYDGGCPTACSVRCLAVNLDSWWPLSDLCEDSALVCRIFNCLFSQKSFFASFEVSRHSKFAPKPFGDFGFTVFKQSDSTQDFGDFSPYFW